MLVLFGAGTQLLQVYTATVDALVKGRVTIDRASHSLVFLQDRCVVDLFKLVGLRCSHWVTHLYQFNLIECLLFTCHAVDSNLKLRAGVLRDSSCTRAALLVRAISRNQAQIAFMIITVC